MNSAVGWGILGTGLIAELFARDLRLHGHDLRAVGSRSAATAADFAARLAVPAHGSYADVVADPRVDIVHVATPHPIHAEHALLAVDAGKHVLVEKPFTLNADQAREVVEAAAARGLLVLEAMWVRFLPHMARVREIVRSGAIGDVRVLTADHTRDLSDDPRHRINDLELGGGALLDLGVYPVSFAWDVLGEPSSVEAFATFKPTGADAAVTISMAHAGGGLSSIVTTSDAPGANRAIVHGTRGRVEIDDAWDTGAVVRRFDESGRPAEEFVNQFQGRGMQYQAAEAERLLRQGTGSSDVLPAEQSVAIMRTLDVIRERIGLVYPAERASPA